MEKQASLEARLREVEDKLEILNLIASHPPSADTGGGGESVAQGTTTLAQ